jgi:hypothetical protein
VSISSFVEAARTIPRYNIAIVDCQRDVFVVTNTFYKLEVCRDDLFGETNTDYRLTLPYAPPLFGSGKTALAINYLTLLDSVGVDWVASQKSLPGLSPEQFLERMKKACFLYVDLSFLRGMPPDERNLEWAVWYLISKLHVGKWLSKFQIQLRFMKSCRCNLQFLLRRYELS